MFCLFQLIKNKIICMVLIAAACFVPLYGSMFADEWDLDCVRRDTGKIKKIVEEYKQGDVEHYFDRHGRKILRTYPDAKSGKKVEYKMYYGKNGKLAQVDCLIDGKLLFYEKGGYDDEGILRSIIRFNAKNEEDFATTMLVYDDSMKILKSYGIQTAQGIIDYFYEYDGEGRLVKVRASMQGRMISSTVYKYNSDGYIVEVQRINEKFRIAGILRNSWKTDKKGNWIQKISGLYSNLARRPSFAEMVSRKIEYAKEER